MGLTQSCPKNCEMSMKNIGTSPARSDQREAGVGTIAAIQGLNQAFEAERMHKENEITELKNQLALLRAMMLEYKQQQSKH